MCKRWKASSSRNPPAVFHAFQQAQEDIRNIQSQLLETWKNRIYFAKTTYLREKQMKTSGGALNQFILFYRN